MMARMTPDQARALLGVGAEATWADVRAAFRTLMRTSHPDLAGGSTIRAGELNEAMAILSAERALLPRVRPPASPLAGVSIKGRPSTISPSWRRPVPGSIGWSG